MKILFLEQFSELGGGQRCLLDLLPAVCDRGWKALVAAPGSGPLFDAARRAGAETAAISLGPYTSGKKTAGDAARFLYDTIRLRKWIARQDADLIYSSGPRPLAAAALGACGRPLLFHAQHFLTDRFSARVAGWAIRRARATVIANSRYVAEQWKPYAAEERLHIVYNGVPEIPFVAREFGRGLPWRIGLIGRIAPMKGQTDFVHAAPLIVPRLPGARFVICGRPMFSDARYFEEVKRLAEGLPVDLIGWRDDVGAVLADLHLLVVPSTSAEGTTRVILEAFSAGVPVLAYSIAGIPEIIRDGENGFLVPESESRALARRILEATEMDLGTVARRARADWECRFTVERYREQMVDILAARSTTN